MTSPLAGSSRFCASPAAVAVLLAAAALLTAGCGARGRPERTELLKLASTEVQPPWFPVLSDVKASPAALPAAPADSAHGGAAPKEDPNAAAERIARKLAEEAARLSAEGRAKAQPDPAPKADPKPPSEDASVMGKELADLGELDPKILDLARTLDFKAAMETASGFGSKVKSPAARKEVERRLSDLKAMEAAFKRLLTELPGEEIEVGDDMSMKVESADSEAIQGRIGAALLSKKWRSLSRQFVLSLFSWDGMTADDEYGVAMLAYAFGFPEDAEKRLLVCVKKDPARTALLSEVISARRGSPLGLELSPYKGEWVTAEEKGLLDKGYEKYQGKWMSPEEVMKAKGFVFYEGRWLTPDQYEKATRQERQLAELAKKLTPKGLIDQPGADHEALEWDKRRKFAFAGGHYTIEADLTMDSVKDIAYIMEVLHANFRRIFGVKSTPNFAVLVGKNKEEYDTILGGGGLGKCGSNGEISTFFQPPNTTMVLMHEGTHQFIFKVAPSCPTWLHEAMATYFECSKFVFNPKTKTMDLKTGLLNRWRLGPIQQEIRNNTCTPLREQINGNIGGLQMYHQGWALSFYLINAKNGFYAPRIFNYLEKHAGKGGQGRKKGEREDKQVMRFMKAMGIYDMNEFEEDWKKFIMSLDISKSEDFKSGHE